MSYHAFISYSHAADGKLAPALQDGLKKFAKPFYRLRALRIFRDETSLHLTPKLWPMIQQTLSQSQHFILMASPGAAGSKWVQDEVNEWLTLHGDAPDNLHIVLTDGEISWDNAADDFDWNRTTALPPNLKGKYPTEPLFLDFRWARDAEQVSLRNPQFLRAIARLAAAIREEELDSLIGEDVRQHRIFKSVSAAAIVLLAFLLVAATGAAFYARDKRQEAEAARDDADKRRQEAVDQGNEAKRQAQIATEQKAFAERETIRAQKEQERAEDQTKLAEQRQAEANDQRKRAEASRDEASHQLAEYLADRAEEQSVPGNDIVQAFHLATRAAMVAPKGRPETSFHIARVLHMAASLPQMRNLKNLDGELRAGVLSPEAKYLLAENSHHKVGLWDVETGDRMPLPASLEAKVGKLADRVTGDDGEEWEALQFSPDGRLAAAMIGRHTLWIWTTANGKQVAELPTELDYQLRNLSFSDDSQLMIATIDDCENAPNKKESECCRAVLWQAGNSAVKPASTVVQCGDGGVSPKTLLYRGRRPIRIGRGNGSEGEIREEEGRNWLTFGTTSDKKTVVAVSRNGQVGYWNNSSTPLVRKVPLMQQPLAARMLADGSSLLILNRDGRLVQQRFDGMTIWSASVTEQTQAAFGAGAIWITSRPDTFLITYAREAEDDSPGWMEVWRLGDSRPRQRLNWLHGSVADVILFPDESGGITEVVGDNEYNYLNQWSFANPDSSSSRTVRRLGNVIKGIYFGLSRDGKVLIEGSDRELRLLDPASRKPVFAPFVFNAERSIGESAVGAILRHARDLETTPDGIRGTLPNGQVAVLYRDRIGARLEINGRVVRGTSNERDHVLSPDGELMSGIIRYRSAGGDVGSMYDLVIREVETGRVIAGHYRVPSSRIVGFTPGNKTVLVQNHDGELLELFVHSGDSQAPAWYGDLGTALTGLRLLPNLGLSSSSEAAYTGAQQRVRSQIERTRPTNDEVTRFILSRLAKH